MTTTRDPFDPRFFVFNRMHARLPYVQPKKKTRTLVNFRQVDKSAEAVEEALRQTLLASKRERQTQDQES